MSPKHRNPSSTRSTLPLSAARSIALLLGVLAAGVPADDARAAANVYWDRSTTAGIQGGNGNWNNGAFWSTNAGGTGPLTTWTGGSNAFFQADTSTAYTLNYNVQNGVINVNNLTVDKANDVTLAFITNGSQHWNITGAITVKGGSSLDFTVYDTDAAPITGLPPVILQGGSTLIGDNTGVSGAKDLNFDGLTVNVGDNTATVDRAAAKTITLNFTGATRNTGGTIDYRSTGSGTNGTDRILTIGNTAVGFIDQGSFFNGADYSYVNTASGYVRAPIYGTDAGFVTTLSTGKHVNLTGNTTQSASIAVNTINFSTNKANLTLGTGVTLTLNNGGLLRSVGKATTISGGTGIATGTAGLEYVFRTDAAADTLTISTPILANGVNALTKSGLGVLTLSGSNAYTGTTYLNDGTLALGGSGSFANSSAIVVGDAGSSGAILDLTAKSSPFTFGSGQTLKGIGTVNIGAGKTVINNGTLAAGNSIGTLSVTGNYTFGGTSAWQVETDAATSDKIAITGTAAIQAGASIAFSGTTGLGKYILATAAAGLNSGVFAGAAPIGYALKYSATELDLRHQPVIGAIAASAGLKVLLGQSVPFRFTVANAAPADSSDLAFSASPAAGTSGSASGTATPQGTSSPASGLSFSDSGVSGFGKTATFQVSDPNAANGPLTGTVAVDVYEPIAIGAAGNLVTNAQTSVPGTTVRANAVIGADLDWSNPEFDVTGLAAGTILAPGTTTSFSNALSDPSNKLNGPHRNVVSVTIGYDAAQGIEGTPAGTPYNFPVEQTLSGNVVDGGNLHAPQTAIVLKNQSYAGFSSRVVANVLDDNGEYTLGTTATLLGGTVGSYHTLSMTWRARNAAEVGAGGGPQSGRPSPIISDVVDLSNSGNDPFVLQLTYDDSQFAAGQEASFASHGTIYVAHLLGSTWTNAGAPSLFQGVGPWNGSDLALGDWGVDTAANTVWAVVDYSGTFAVVPEPETIILLGVALVSGAIYTWVRPNRFLRRTGTRVLGVRTVC